jgi:predicted nucleic acid-binding protein
MSQYKILYVDVNVFLDFVCGIRAKEDKKNALALFSLAEKNLLILCTSPVTISFAKNFLRKEFSEKQAKQIVINSLKLLEITTVNQVITDKALANEMLDWEDAIHYFSALHYGADCIITRNVKDFKNSQIPILTPAEFIHQYLNNL